MNTNGKNWFQLAPEEQFAVASEKFFRHASVGRYNNKCREWSRRLAHAALTLHPGLRKKAPWNGTSSLVSVGSAAIAAWS